MEYINKNRIFICNCFLLIMLIGSIGLRVWLYDDNKDYTNINASYHALLTIEAMHENPISTHKFLPIVTLGDTDDKFIPWGATIPDDKGNYFYTSFPQLGFVVPWIIFSLLHLPFTIQYLMFFNLFIYFFACVACYIFIVRVLKSCSGSNNFNQVTAAVLTLVYMFNNESFYSHGIIYWSQSLYQLFWFIQLIIFSYIIDENFYNKHRIRLFIAFFFISFICPATEWAGYIANFGLLTVFVYRFFKNKEDNLKNRISILIILISTFLAIMWFTISFLTINDAHTIINTILSRFGVRTIQENYPNIVGDLIVSYFESFGLYFIGLVILLLSFAVFRNKIIKVNRKEKVWAFVTLFPMLENVIMMQHATAYTYDRLKLIIFAITIASILFLHISEKKRWILYAFLFSSMIISISQALITANLPSNYYTENNIKKGYIRSWKIESISFNNVIKSELKKYGRVILAQKYGISGYSNILFNQGIYSFVPDMNTLWDITCFRNETKAVWLMNEDAGWGIYIYTNAFICDFAENKLKIIGVINKNDIMNGSIKIREELIPYIKNIKTMEINGQEIEINGFDEQKKEIKINKVFSIEKDYIIYSFNTTIKPDHIEAANFTDSNWANGISTRDNTVLLNNTLANREILKNAKFIITNDNKKITILKIIYPDEFWIHLYLDNIDSSNLQYPNEIKIGY